MSKDIIEYLNEYQKGYPVAARLSRYVQLADAIEANDDNSLSIKLLKNYVGRCNDALETDDIDLFAQSFEYVIRYAVELNLPQYDAVKQRERGRKGGKAGKGKHSYFANMLMEICDQIGSTKNSHVLQAWRRLNNRHDCDYMDENSVWYTYELWGKQLFSRDNFSPDEEYFTMWMPDNKFEYYYLDEIANCEKQATLGQIRTALARIRKSGYKPKSKK